MSPNAYPLDGVVDVVSCAVLNVDVGVAVDARVAGAAVACDATVVWNGRRGATHEEGGGGKAYMYTTHAHVCTR